MIIQVSKCVEWRVLCVVTESINENYEFKRIDSRGQAGEYRWVNYSLNTRTPPQSVLRGLYTSPG
jgi:hypothetical protein